MNKTFVFDTTLGKNEKIHIFNISAKLLANIELMSMPERNIPDNILKFVQFPEWITKKDLPSYYNYLTQNETTIKEYYNQLIPKPPYPKIVSFLRKSESLAVILGISTFIYLVLSIILLFAFHINYGIPFYLGGSRLLTSLSDFELNEYMSFSKRWFSFLTIGAALILNLFRADESE